MAILLSSNVAGNLNVTSNIVTNTLQLVGVGSLAATPPGAVGPNVGSIYMKNVANTVLVYSSYPVANNTNYNIDVPLQSHIGYRDIFRVIPAANASGFFSDSLSMNVQSNATLTIYPSNASPIYKNSKTRVQLNANSTLLGNANAVLYANTNVAWTGNGAGVGNGGGFLYITVFSIDNFANSAVTNTSTNFFAGVANLNAIIPFNVTNNVDPCVNTVFNMFGVGGNSNTGGNLQIIFGRSGSTRNLTDCGTSFNLNTNDVYELSLWASPSAVSANSVVGARVRNLTNGAEVSALTTSNVPRTNTFLSPVTYVQGNVQGTGTALAVQNAQISIYREYLETLY
jgi:hypothetical protein